uniref:Uncharacterized protein n=1 Tax=Cryptomonas curvata TaxID=233186 RepID=A0A7S0M8Y8_9CRYP|mmetsp:Transcript_27474/g.57124  ORF Transcript_27474/g.57124 Transcript_27474/m.57124 type:complete len:106 (+) Transcript_27474:34-351(+)
MQDCEKSSDEMNLMEFLDKYADLSAEQREEVNTSFKQYGIHDFDALRHFATKDLISNLELSEETAKKVQLATMKNTCLLFAELAEIGGIPLMSSEPVDVADHMDE